MKLVYRYYRFVIKFRTLAPRNKITYCLTDMYIAFKINSAL